MTVALVGVPTFYVWNELSVFYYYGSENEKGELLDSEHAKLGSASNPITQLVISLKAEVLIRRKSGIVYYSRVMSKDAFKVSVDIDPSTILTFDELGKVIGLKIESDKITKSPVNISYQMVQESYPQLQCPYKDFMTSSVAPVNVYRMDYNDTVVIFTLIVLKQMSMEEKIKMTIDNRVLVNVTNILTHHLDDDEFSQDMVIKFNASDSAVNFNPRGDTFVGRVGFLLEPDFDEEDGVIVCPSPGKMIGFIYVGCPGNKRLIYQSNQRREMTKEREKECSEFMGTKGNPYEYVLHSSQIRYLNGTKGPKSLRVKYDFDTLGCPLTINFVDKFIPSLALAEEVNNKEIERPLKNVEFVVYERYNRKFEYSKNARQAKCNQPVQTWKNLSESSDESDMGFVWTPANYKSCFVEDGKPKSDNSTVDPDAPYQILNGRVDSALTFTHSGSLGIYVFTAVVVDRKFSFCRLNVTFAVNVIGKPVRKDLIALYIALGIFFFVSIVAFSTLFFYFRNYVYGK